MYSVVDLKDCNVKFVVKTAWCEGMQSATVKNRGNRPSIQRTIYYSPNPKDSPNFTLPVFAYFEATRAACYKGYVLKTFGKFILR